MSEKAKDFIRYFTVIYAVYVGIASIVIFLTSGAGR